MTTAQLFGLASSLSLLAGWRLYLTVFAAGLAMRAGWIDPPAHTGLGFIASSWVIGAAGVAATAEFLADKIAWVDTAWDAVHTLVRPLGGALVALAVVDARDPGWQLASLLMGGGAALLTHTAKASARAVVQASPEPVSNALVSTGEDVASMGLLALVLAHPALAGAVAVALALAAAGLLWLALRTLGRIRLRLRRAVGGR